MKFIKWAVFFFVSIIISFNVSCNKNNINPNIPNVPINITIDPNSTLIQELNTVGGWVYLDEKPGIFIPSGSRGVMVYRMDVHEFKAFERQPPNDPNKCCDGNVCTKLLIGEYFPLAKDTCTGTSYLLLDGSIIEGEGPFPLIEYAAIYDGNLLHIYN